MKKLLILFLSLICFSLNVMADEKSDVLAAFDKYIVAANTYSKDLPNYYINNAKIYRVVNKKTGGQATVQVPFDRYVKELNSHAVLAKTVGYKNNYVNRKITKYDATSYKITATRIPRNDKTGLSSYFIFTKTPTGWKIKEESMTTNQQVFLNAK